MRWRLLALLGAASVMITRIGTDPLGDMVAADFVRFGLDPRGLQRDPARATGTVAVHMSGTQHRFEIGADSARDHLDAAEAVRVVRESAPVVAYFGTLAQRHAVSRGAIRAALAASDALSFLDLNLRDGADNRALTDDSLNARDSSRSMTTNSVNCSRGSCRRAGRRCARPPRCCCSASTCSA